MSKKSVLHDSDVHRHPQMMRLRREGGWKYYGAYWGLVEAMRERSELGLKREFLEAEFFGLGIDDETGNAIVALCIETGAFEESDGVVFSPALRKRVQAYEAVCAADRERKNRGRTRSSDGHPTDKNRTPESVTQNANSNSNINTNINSSDIYINEFRDGYDPHTLTPEERVELISSMAHSHGNEDWFEHHYALCKNHYHGQHLKGSWKHCVDSWLRREAVDYSNGPEHFGKPVARRAKNKTETNLDILARTL